MLPPMIYRTINPDLVGLDTENAYLKVCQLVLPPGLMGLMLTGMYFSTSASANTTLNVVSAVFTNDIYKGMINPAASDKKLMSIARLSSLVFGIGMIIIALLVPAAGGIVEVVLSIGAVTGGPLLAPALWALFSKKLTGKATLWITGSTLTVNLIFKIVLPITAGFKLSRSEEMLLGIGLPIILLAINEWLFSRKTARSSEYEVYQAVMAQRKFDFLESSEEEKTEARRQNQFGLRVIAGALAFTAFLLFVLSALTTIGSTLTASIAFGILLTAIIPWRASKKIAVISTETKDTILHS
jgi:Na+/proline symporter